LNVRPEHFGFGLSDGNFFANFSMLDINEPGLRGRGCAGSGRRPFGSRSECFAFRFRDTVVKSGSAGPHHPTARCRSSLDHHRDQIHKSRFERLYACSPSAYQWRCIWRLHSCVFWSLTCNVTRIASCNTGVQVVFSAGQSPIVCGGYSHFRRVVFSRHRVCSLQRFALHSGPRVVHQQRVQ
jgi:hypothetical protein